jgi:excisionase family DNA binding protein
MTPTTKERGHPFGIDPHRWYTVKEVAAILGYDEMTIRRRIEAGKIRAFRLPKSRNGTNQYYRVQGLELVRVIEENTR